MKIKQMQPVDWRRNNVDIEMIVTYIDLYSSNVYVQSPVRLSSSILTPSTGYKEEEKE